MRVFQKGDAQVAVVIQNTVIYLFFNFIFY